MKLKFRVCSIFPSFLFFLVACRWNPVSTRTEACQGIIIIIIFKVTGYIFFLPALRHVPQVRYHGSIKYRIDVHPSILGASVCHALPRFGQDELHTYFLQHQKRREEGRQSTQSIPIRPCCCYLLPYAAAVQIFACLLAAALPGCLPGKYIVDGYPGRRNFPSEPLLLVEWRGLGGTWEWRVHRRQVPRFPTQV